MAPRTRRTTSAINQLQEQPSKRVESTKKVDSEQLSQPHRVLQDITERFAPAELLTPEQIDSPIASTHEQPTLGRPKRKPKAPTGALATKLKLAKTPAKPLIPSSLPPSSPPPSSSRYPEDENEPPYHQPQPQPDSGGMDDVDFYGDEFEFDGGPSADQSLSDPFGFFAVEKQLKLKRENDANSRYRVPILELAHHVLASQSDGDPPTPQANDGDNEMDTHYVGEEREHATPPPTPRKRVGKRRAVASPGRSSTRVYSPVTASLPSTPSPMKAGVNVGRRVVMEKGSDVGDRAELVVEKGKGKGKERGDGKEGKEKEGKAKKPRASGEPVNPLELARTLEALLPKRPVKTRDKAGAKAGRGRKGKVLVESGDSDGGAGRKRNKGKGKVGKGKRKGKEGGEVINLDGEEREKWELERQARVEYFKKLEGYTVEKENVYVI